MRLRIATCRPLPEPDVDERPLLDALAGAGIEAQCVPWHDADRWASSIPTIVRSTWDYIHRVEDFDAWMVGVASQTTLWNPAPVMAQNLHKRYLLDLAAHGVPTVPTRWLTRGTTQRLSAVAASLAAERVVIKPAVGAGSFETHLLEVSQADSEALFQRLVGARDTLVQPYLPSVEGHGERALVWIDGRFTHAVRKSPRFAADVEQVSDALEITAEERAVGEAALARWRHELLYARVDVALGSDGRPLVMELELIEPSLFLVQYPPALDRLVTGLRARLATLSS